MRELRWRWFWLASGAALVLLVTWLCLRPSAGGDQWFPHADKVQHAAAFLGLGGLVLALFERRHYAAACIALLTHYLRHVLGGWRPALGISGLLVALYGVLYGILQSEDNALVMGSLLLFGVLAAVMVTTRKIDWYNVMGSGPAAAVPDVAAERV